MLIYSICFSLSDFTLYDRLEVHPHLSSTNDPIAFLFMSHVILYTDRIFIHSSVDGHSGRFHVLAVVSSGKWTLGSMYLFRVEFSSDIRPGAGHMATLFLVFLRKLRPVFHSGCANLCAHQQCGRAPPLHTLSSVYCLSDYSFAIFANLLPWKIRRLAHLLLFLFPQALG